MTHLKLHSFCACGHLGQRHHDHKPHPCANPHCDCAGYHHDTYHRPPDSWMREGRHPRGRRRAGVRGIVCRSCNQALGQVRDNPEHLRSLATYIERWRGRASKSA